MKGAARRHGHYSLLARATSLVIRANPHAVRVLADYVHGRQRPYDNRWPGERIPRAVTVALEGCGAHAAAELADYFYRVTADGE